ncbi:hypothetical protein [Lacticaseibacillus manihotivorans]|uniref:hypothetical protein n=1 Tax=Lacticaseibacillus manihotivorans TaxID=88233 RepID=UPI000AA45939|nr:hypothetical protein [Lacticaseibacillus manihotivorans]
MKKLIAFLSLLAFSCIVWGQTQTVHAQDLTTLMLHKRIYVMPAWPMSSSGNMTTMVKK